MSWSCFFIWRRKCLWNGGTALTHDLALCLAGWCLESQRPSSFPLHVDLYTLRKHHSQLSNRRLLDQRSTRLVLSLPSLIDRRRRWKVLQPNCSKWFPLSDSPRLVNAFGMSQTMSINNIIAMSQCLLPVRAIPNDKGCGAVESDGDRVMMIYVVCLDV